MNDFLTMVKDALDNDCILSNYVKIFYEKHYKMVYVVYYQKTLKFWVYNDMLVNSCYHGSIGVVDGKHISMIVDKLEEMIKHG